ncbi:MAG: TonB-dependent receptor [Sphingobacteriales bacterium]|nr:TonB-dependent receptor [Sphingobacteriales bacterium]
MRKARAWWLFIFLLCLFQQLSAQVTIKGTVKDHKGNPVPGASVAIKDSYDGGTTDSSGKFSFKTFEKGDKTLQITSIGFKMFEQAIKIESGAVTVDAILKQEISELTAVVLSAGTFEASDRKRATAVLDPIDIVTTASANGDVTGALKTLPGAQQVGESEGLFVRGGTAAETKIFIDGTLVNNFFNSSVPNIASYGRFSPFLFKGTMFSTGGYSALYGQALSSALILESIDLPDRTSANLGLSIIGVNGGYQGLAKNKNSSYGVSYSYTNLAPAFELFKQKQEYIQNPEYHAGDANFRIKTSKTGMLKYYAYFSSGRLDFTTPGIDSLGYKDRFGLTNFNMYHNLSWKESLGKKWKLYAGMGYTLNKDNIHSGMQDDKKNDVVLTGLEFKKFSLDLDANYFNAKMVFEKKFKGLTALRFGSEYNYSNENSVFTLFNGQQFPERLKEGINSLFAEGDIYITNNLAAKTGFRVEHSSTVDKTNIAPRVSLAYKFTRQVQVSFAYGIFYQDPERKYLPSPNLLTFMKATHYIAQFMKITTQRSFRTEIFYKKYNNLLKTGNVNGREGVAINNNGYGEAKGIEFFWRDKKTIKNVDYWISYSYLDTRRDFLNFPYATTPNFAAKNTASLVIKKFVTAWKMQFNGAYNYASSRPYYNIIPDGNSGYKFTDIGLVPDYHNFSFAINYLPTIGKKDAKNFAVYVLSISNVFNLKQVYGYQFSYNGSRKEEITPTSRMFVYIGAFFSFGIDRSQESIDRLF